MSDKADNKSTFEMIVFIIGVISAIAFIMSFFKKDDDKEGKEKAQADRDKLYKKIPPSYPNYVYEDYANTLDTALLRSADEDEDTVYSIFEHMRNDSDVQKTIEAFREKRQMFSSTYITLPQAITLVLSKREIFKLNKILLGRGIAYQFH